MLHEHGANAKQVFSDEPRLHVAFSRLTENHGVIDCSVWLTFSFEFQIETFIYILMS